MQMSKEVEMKGKYVAIYCRVSTKEQAEEGYSLEAQEDLCRSVCINMGISEESIKIYKDEGISGKSIEGREQLKRLLNDIEDGIITLVCVWKLNRLSRSMVDTAMMLEKMREKGVKIKALDQPIDLETSFGRLSVNLTASIAQYERENIAENVKIGMRVRAKNGEWNGGAVIGYDNKKEKGKSGLVINQQEASLVRKIFNMFLEGKGYRTIASILNAQGYRTKGNKGREKKKFSGDAIKYILTNSLYIGKVSFNKRVGRKIVERVEFSGIHEAIIDKDIWEKVQRLIKEKKGQPSRVMNGKALLTGKMKCPYCGASMVIGTSVYKRKDGTKSKYIFYKCSQKTAKGDNACDMKHIVKGKEIERQVIDKLRILGESNKILEDVIQGIKSENEKNIEPLKEEAELVLQKINKAKERRKKIFDLFLDGTLKKESIQDEIEETEKIIRANERRLSDIKSDLEAVEICGGIDQEKIKNMIKSIFDEFDNVDIDSKKMIIQILIKEVFIKNDGTLDRVQLKLDKKMLKDLGVSLDISKSLFLMI